MRHLAFIKYPERFEVLPHLILHCLFTSPPVEVRGQNCVPISEDVEAWGGHMTGPMSHWVLAEPTEAWFGPGVEKLEQITEGN